MKTIIVYGVCFVLLVLTGCGKFLDAKPNKGLVVPEELEQLLSLMRKENESMRDPIYGEISTDDYYWDIMDLNSKQEPIRNTYNWVSKDMFGSEDPTDWVFHYRFIYYANTVLEKLPDIQPSIAEKALWNKAKGEALFYRGKFHYDIAIIWASAYNTLDINKALGVPVRLHTNFNERSYRTSLKDTYMQIVKDIEESVNYLPEIAEHVTRPSKLTARAMLARIYLSMGKYEQALQYAEEVLKVKSELIDFKTLATTAAYPLPMFNKEVIFHSHMQTSMSNIYMNPDLFESYSDDDLRKDHYFKYQNNGKVNFKGSYYGSSVLFAGLAVDEMYLIAAECSARKSGLDNARRYLHSLLDMRYNQDTAPRLEGLSKEELILYILAERRKELVFRGLRWGDVKRLNNEGKDIHLKRYASDGEVVYLKPNDLRFNLPIPEGILHLSDIEQNPR